MIENIVPRGPEHVPLRKIITDLPIVVAIYKLDEDKPYRIEHVNFGNSEHRKWIGTVTAWALTNGCSVETMAKVDWDKLD